MTDINFKVDGNWTNAALAIYKVGAIYMSVDSTSPATLFGGTWVALEGRMLIGADSTYGAGTTGGSKTTTLGTSNLPAHAHSVGAHKHTVPQHGHGFTQPKIPAHAHNSAGWGGFLAYVTQTSMGKDFILPTASQGTWVKVIGTTGNSSTPSCTGGAVSDKAAFNTNDSTAFNTGNTGSGSAFDTISPYLAVYMWKRTA